jgi:Domain of unknown function (DUF6916)
VISLPGKRYCRTVQWYFGGEPVRDLASLTVEDFAPLKGSRFSGLTLAEVNELEREPGGRAPFSLVFEGEPGLPQGIQRLEHETLGPLDVFLVPVGAGRYEAVFT